MNLQERSQEYIMGERTVSTISSVENIGKSQQKKKKKKKLGLLYLT